MARLANTIEAILYLKARPLSLGQLAELAGCDRDATEEGLIELMGDYAHRDSALEIAETENGYCLQLKTPFKPLVEELIPLEIGLGALRTLAAIALSGTISQTDLVELRGSGAYQHVPELIDQGMVRKRRQSDGRSFWLHVTEKFYQRFEIDKLPKITLPKKGSTADAADDEAEGTSEGEGSGPETTIAAATVGSDAGASRSGGDSTEAERSPDSDADPDSDAIEAQPTDDSAETAEANAVEDETIENTATQDESTQTAAVEDTAPEAEASTDTPNHSPASVDTDSPVDTTDSLDISPPVSASSSPPPKTAAEDPEGQDVAVAEMPESPAESQPDEAKFSTSMP